MDDHRTIVVPAANVRHIMSSYDLGGWAVTAIIPLVVDEKTYTPQLVSDDEQRFAVYMVRE